MVLGFIYHDSLTSMANFLYIFPLPLPVKTYCSTIRSKYFLLFFLDKPWVETGVGRDGGEEGWEVWLGFKKTWKREAGGNWEGGGGN